MRDDLHAPGVFFSCDVLTDHCVELVGEVQEVDVLNVEPVRVFVVHVEEDLLDEIFVDFHGSPVVAFDLPVAQQAVVHLPAFIEFGGSPFFDDAQSWD